MRTRQQSVDLGKFMAVCEANYVRLCQLLPDIDTIDCREFGLPASPAQFLCVRIDVIERCRYTTIVTISQYPPSTPWADAPSMTVRLYHDARMAEVTAFQGKRHFQARYDYPNKAMYHRDEKQQLNYFLGEWLTHCLQHGHCLEKVALADNIRP